MARTPYESYYALMAVIRTRFDMINMLKGSNGDRFLVAESCAFHSRKILEAIAFGCLVSVEHGLGAVPRDAKGKWKADAILKSLAKKGLGTAFPSPSIIRAATQEERQQYAATVTIEGQPNRRLTIEELVTVYTQLHR